MQGINKREFIVAGIMSGTSLDGVDIALCRFSEPRKDRWNYIIEKAQTFNYSEFWKHKLNEAETNSGLELLLLHKQYGTYLGEIVQKFLKGEKLKPDFISSHGHTIFHQPEKKLTFQLGDGAFIAATTGINTVSDFRNLDTALGGQGAPLVPIGDDLLFPNYGQYLNLGGFANISYTTSGKRIAFDICPVNIILNWLSQKYFNKEYDKHGILGKSGKVNFELLEKLNNFDFFKKAPPKSLGREWMMNFMIPLLNQAGSPPEDIMRTVYENISFQISLVINSIPSDNVLITGGGAFNQYLIQLLQDRVNKLLILPEKIVIEYKEALIFAFLGVLRYLNMPNCLASVTGASIDCSGGIVHYIR